MKRQKNTLSPKNFKHIPEYLRPRKSFRADRNFVKQVKRVDKYGQRANSENIGDVVTVLDNMRRVSPKLFHGRQKTYKRRALPLKRDLPLKRAFSLKRDRGYHGKTRKH